MSKIRVLVVDDSAFMRKLIGDILREDSDIEVVGIARNGLEALAMAEQHNPDVITLDVEMPVMDGITCLKKLNEKDLYKVIMLSSVTIQGAKHTIDALENGAVDFITKPENLFQISSLSKKAEIIEKIKIAYKSSKISNDIFKAEEVKKITNIEVKNRSDLKNNKMIKNIVALGTSTGGPKALQSVIPFLPADFPGAVLVVQHMPPGFTKSLANRLNDISPISVKEAEDGEKVQAGYVYIAPGDKHLLLKRNGNELSIKLTLDPLVSGHRPSVDAMMDSVSDTGLDNLIGVIMTGMGADGSKGLKKIKEINKGYTIAQDEKSCVVYGMPRVAVEMGIVDKVVSLPEIPKVILKYMGVQ